MLGPAVRRIILASIFVALSGTSAGAQPSGQEGAQGDAVTEIVAAFKQHPVVIIGEAHWLRQAAICMYAWFVIRSFKKPFKIS